MAVLVECFSVVVRREAIELWYNGGWDAFWRAVPNQTLCTDDVLARVGFQTPPDTEEYCDALQAAGLTFLQDGKAIDFTVVDQFTGPMRPADWLEFTHLDHDGAGHEIAVCQLWDGVQFATGFHYSSEGVQVAFPAGWTWERSMSANAGFIPDEDLTERLQFLRHEADGVDVFYDRASGKEVYLGGIPAEHGEPEPHAGGDPPAEMTLEYRQTMELALENAELTAEERERLRTELEAAGEHDRLKTSWAKHIYEEATVQHMRKYGSQADREAQARQEVWDAAGLPERLRMDGLECPELDALEASTDPQDAEARRRAGAALEALVKLAAIERRGRRSEAGYLDALCSAVHKKVQAEKRAEAIAKKYMVLEAECLRLACGDATTEGP